MISGKSFSTAVNCMDGRTQDPVARFCKKTFNTDYVDTITEAGPIRILAEGVSNPLTASILARVDISVNKHGSTRIVLVAHHDCTGNPVGKDAQMGQLGEARTLLASRYPSCKIVSVWVNENWEVEPVVD